jgi:hypothetical protein
MDAMDRQIDPAVRRRRLIRRIVFPAAALIVSLVMLVMHSEKEPTGGVLTF